MKDNLFYRITRPLNRFRKNEASAIVVDSLVIAAALSLVLAVLLLFRPALRMAHLRSLASDGKVAETVQLIDRLQEQGQSEASLNDVRRRLAQALIRQERWDEAIQQLSAMSGDGADGMLLQARYGRAAALQADGAFSQAAQAFYQLGDYMDSRQRVTYNQCALAVESWLGGDADTARELLLNAEDAETVLASAAEQAAGSPEAAQAVLANELFTPEYLNRTRETMKALSAARDGMPAGRIAAGYRHSAALTGQGTVLATGDNSCGQCGVSSWTEIVQIAAGAYHTVGLRLDGTVLAAGDNSRGQCDVSSWTDITAVAATAYGTLGLKSDGTVVACGLGSDKTAGWHGVTEIAGGGYSAGCLYDQGSMLSTHAGAQLPLGVRLYSLAVCGSVSVGVTQDGSLVSTYDALPAWQNVVSVSVSETCVTAVLSDGQARMYTFRTGQDASLAVSGAAAETAAGGTHCLVLTADGRVCAAGDNTYGQCDTASWRL